MKCNGEPLLPEGRNFAGFAEDTCALRNQQQTSTRKVDIRRDHAIHRTWLFAIKPIRENGFDDRAFRKPVHFLFRRIKVERLSGLFRRRGRGLRFRRGRRPGRRIHSRSGLLRNWVLFPLKGNGLSPFLPDQIVCKQRLVRLLRSLRLQLCLL